MVPPTGDRAQRRELDHQRRSAAVRDAERDLDHDEPDRPDLRDHRLNRALFWNPKALRERYDCTA